MLDFQKLTLSDGKFQPSAIAPLSPLIDPKDLSFVICVEGNIIGTQALLLCRSLRRFGGRYKDCAIVAVSPRPELPPSQGLIAALDALAVRTVILPLNQTGSTYGPINRVVASAWAERALNTAFIAALDSDMAFVAAPEFLLADVGLRPVDTKGTASTGPDDPMDVYWARVFERAGISLNMAPWLISTSCKTRVRASYNGGFCVVRRSLGLFATTQDVFFAGFQTGIAPTPDPAHRIMSSTGQTTAEATSWWGSSQAALSAAVSVNARNILIYPESYNIPLHIISRRPAAPAKRPAPVLIHYHHLSAPVHHPALAIGLDRIGAAPDVRDWLLSQFSDVEWSQVG